MTAMTASRSTTLACAAAVFIVLAGPLESRATPGPDSVAVLANAATATSVALMDEYASRRHIPPTQRCKVSVKPFVDVGLHDFRNKIVLPLVQCLNNGAALDRVEAIVLMRGMPRRVLVKFEGGSLRVSLAAALAIWRSSVAPGEEDIRKWAPGRKVPCGKKNGKIQYCWGAKWANPYREGPFGPSWERKVGPVHWRMWLVTALDGYTDQDVRTLIDSAMNADTPDLKAEWLMMKGADKARGALDGQYPVVAQQLQGLVPGPVSQVKFKSNLTGKKLMGFVTGTAKLGATIEGNSYAPGAIVDNLTSFGAVPTNFVAPEAGGQQSQVSVSRWVRSGVAGVHGTVSEPLNNCFPSRKFLVDYAGGATLAEAYWKNLPFVYWMNLVIGDPMVAPFARRPTIAIESMDGLATVVGDEIKLPATGTVRFKVTADGGDDALEGVAVYVDGAVAASVTDSTATFEFEVGNRHVVAVARAAKSDTGAGIWESKGWQGWNARVAVKRGNDQGQVDASGTDAGEPSAPSKPPGDDDDGCSASRSSGPYGWLNLIVFALFALGIRMRRRPLPATAQGSNCSGSKRPR